MTLLPHLEPPDLCTAACRLAISRVANVALAWEIWP
jgi:hypothetical protein